MEDQDKEQFKLYRRRFLIVILFALSQFTISMLLNTLNPIVSYLKIIYGQTNTIVNLGGLLFTLMHPIFTFPASYVIDTYGTRAGITVGSCFAIVGVALRMLVNKGFGWVIAGQVLAGIGRPFILNCQAKISANWFSAKSRGQVTQILTLVLNVSLIVGLFIPGIVFKGYEPKKDDPQNIQKGKNRTFQLMALEALITAVLLLPNIIFQKNNPPTPPSDAGSIKRQPFKVAMSKLFKNRNFLLLLAAFGCAFGMFNAIAITLSFLIEPFFSKDILPFATIVVGGSPIISGIIGVTVFGPLQRKSKVYKKWIIICMCGSITAIALFYPLLITEILALVSFISAFNSFFLIPLVPIMLQLGCQLVFPVGEGSAVGLLFATGNFGGFLLGLIMVAIVKGQTRQQTAGGLGFVAGIFILGLILILLMKQQKNRQKYESQQSERRRALRGSLISTDDHGIIKSTTGDQNDGLRASLLDKGQENAQQRDQGKLQRRYQKNQPPKFQ